MRPALGGGPRDCRDASRRRGESSRRTSGSSPRYPASGYTDNALLAGREARGGPVGADRQRCRPRAGGGAVQAADRRVPAELARRAARPELARLQRAKARPRRERRPRGAGDPGAAARDACARATCRRCRAPAALRPRAGGRRRAPAPAERATIRDIKRVTLPGAVRVTIELDREVTLSRGAHRQSRPRVPRSARHGAAGRPARDADVQATARCGRSASGSGPTTARAWCSKWTAPTRHSVFALYDPYRLVIDCELPGAADAPARASARRPSRCPP